MNRGNLRLESFDVSIREWEFMNGDGVFEMFDRWTALNKNCS